MFLNLIGSMLSSASVLRNRGLLGIARKETRTDQTWHPWMDYGRAYQINLTV